MITLWARDVHHKQNWVSKGKTFAQGCYLHGKLEEKNGFDLFDMEEKDFNAIVEKGNGVERVFVALGNGKSEIADMYFWKSVAYDNYEKAKAKYDRLVKRYTDYEPVDFNERWAIQNMFMNAVHEMETHKCEMEMYPIRALVVLPWDAESVDDAKAKQELRVQFL